MNFLFGSRGHRVFLWLVPTDEDYRRSASYDVATTPRELLNSSSYFTPSRASGMAREFAQVDGLRWENWSLQEPAP